MTVSRITQLPSPLCVCVSLSGIEKQITHASGPQQMAKASSNDRIPAWSPQTHYAFNDDPSLRSLLSALPSADLFGAVYKSQALSMLGKPSTY